MTINDIENDWIGSKGVFFNEKTGEISTNIYDVIDYDNFDIDIEGLTDYLEFGYSVFGHTMVKNVRFLMPNERITKIDKNHFQIFKQDDPVMKDIHCSSNVKDTYEYMESVIGSMTNKKNESIILPLSGGYDSRLLAYFSKHKENTFTFTYGISKNQEESVEVVNANKIASVLGLFWEQINLDNFFEYTNDWLKLFGVSTHAHGMYQMEFYDKIKKNYINNGIVLSGIVGDLWAGNIIIPKIKKPDELIKLGYTHGISINRNNCKIKSKGLYKEEFFESNKYELGDIDWNVVWTIRTKMMLLKYLFQVPQSLGYETQMPFLNYELCMKMLNLSWEEKKGRKWQTEFLDKVGLSSNKSQTIDYANMLDLSVLKNTKLKPLNVSILREFFYEDFIMKINAYINKSPVLYKVRNNHFLNAGNYFITWKCYDEKILKALNAYILLLPIENLLLDVKSKLKGGKV